VSPLRHALIRRIGARGDSAASPETRRLFLSGAGAQVGANDRAVLLLHEQASTGTAAARRERFAGPDEAAKLIDAVPEDDRAIWATAAYAGLRLGELRALEHGDVDLEAGLIRVRRSWDPKEGAIEPKSRAGTRTVPIVAALRVHLAAHLLRQRRRSGLVFGRTETRPFDDRALAIRATKAWTAAKLTPITLHELRHSCASIFIAAGVNAKALSSYLGHASVTITYDRYGHLMPGSEDEAVKLVNAYIERATGAQTGAQGAETAPLRRL
jgi:integrase